MDKMIINYIINNFTQQYFAHLKKSLIFFIQTFIWFGK